MNLAHPAVQLALAALTRRPPRARCTFEVTCRHCTHHTTHETAPRARTAALAHITETGHDALLTDWNGRHRP